MFNVQLTAANSAAPLFAVRPDPRSGHRQAGQGTPWSGSRSPIDIPEKVRRRTPTSRTSAFRDMHARVQPRGAGANTSVNDQPSVSTPTGSAMSPAPRWCRSDWIAVVAPRVRRHPGRCAAEGDLEEIEAAGSGNLSWPGGRGHEHREPARFTTGRNADRLRARRRPSRRRRYHYNGFMPTACTSGRDDRDRARGRIHVAPPG
jgi:hypothetical protein